MRPSTVQSNRPNNVRSFLPTKAISSSVLGLRNTQSQASKLTSKLPNYRSDSRIKQPSFVLGARKVTEEGGKFLRPKNGILANKIVPPATQNLRKKENEENRHNDGDEFKSDPSSLRNILANKSLKNLQQPETKPTYRLSMYQARNVLSENIFNQKDQNQSLIPPSVNKITMASPKVNPFSGCPTTLRESIYYSKSPSCKLKFGMNTSAIKPMSSVKKFTSSRNVSAAKSNIFLSNPNITSRTEMRTSLYSRPGLKLNSFFQVSNKIPEIVEEKEDTIDNGKLMSPDTLQRRKNVKLESKDITLANTSVPIENPAVNKQDFSAERNFFAFKSNIPALDNYLQSLSYEDLRKELLFVNDVEMLIRKHLLTKTIANSTTTSHLRITPSNKQTTLAKIDEIDSGEKSDNGSNKDIKFDTFTRIQECQDPGQKNCESSPANVCDLLQASKPHTPVDAQFTSAKTPKTLLKSAARSSSPIKPLTDESLLLVAAAAAAKHPSNSKLLIDFGPEMSLDSSPISSQNEDDKNRVERLFICSSNDLEQLSVSFFNATNLNGKNGGLSMDNEANATKNSVKMENLIDLRLVPYS